MKGELKLNTKEANIDVSESKIRLTQTLSLKDLITIVSVAVTLALAWGVFSTRVTLLEKEVVTLTDKLNKAETDLNVIKDSVRRLEQQQQYDELYIDRLYEEAKKATPRRSTR